MTNLRQEDGFTLLESLVVLMISSFILLFPLLSIERAAESVQVDMFFRDLTSQITLMQNHAMLTKQPTKITVQPRKNTIHFRVINTENHELQYHPINRDLNVNNNPYCQLAGTSNRDLIFKSESGHIVNPNSIFFDTNRGRYRLVFQIGSGRIEIREY